MEWNSIQQSFSSWRSGHQAMLQIQSLLGSDLFNYWKPILEDTEVPITVLSVDVQAENKIEFAGTIRPAKGIHYAIFFSARKKNETVQFEIELRPQGTWYFSDTFAALAETDLVQFGFSSASLRFVSSTGEEELPEIRFSGQLLAAAVPENFRALGLAASGMEGEIEFLDGIPVFRIMGSISVDFARAWLSHGEVFYGFDVRRNFAGEDETPVASLLYVLSTTVEISTGDESLHIPVTTFTSHPAHTVLINIGLNEVSDFALDKIIHLLGSEPFTLPAPLSNLKPEELVRLESIRIWLTPASGMTVNCIEAAISFGREKGIHFPSPENPLLSFRETLLHFTVHNPLSDDASIRLRLKSEVVMGDEEQRLLLYAGTVSNALRLDHITAELPEGASLQLNALWTHFTGRSAAQLPAIAVTELSLSAHPEEKSRRISGVIDSDWSVEWDNRHWGISEVEFTLEHTEEGVYGAWLFGRGLIADLSFRLSAEHPAEESSGWQLNGSLEDDEENNLGYLLVVLAEEFGFPEPENIPEIFLREISIAFNTKSGDFHFAAEATVETSIGEIDPSAFATHARVEVNVQKDDAGVHRISATLLATLLIGGTEFEFALVLSRREQLGYAQWKAAEGKELHLFDIIRLFDPQHDLTAFENQADDLLTLTSVSFLYDHTSEGTQTLALGAQTKGGLTAYLVGKKEGSWSFLFGLEYDNPSEKLSAGERTALNFFRIKAAALVVATNDFTDFRLPELPHFAGQETPLNPFLAEHDLSMHKGAYLLLEVAFRENSNATGTALRNTIRQPELLLRAGYDADLKSPTFEADLSDIFLPKEQGNLLLKEVSLRISTSPELTLLLRAAVHIDWSATASFTGSGQILIAADQAEGTFEISSFGKEAVIAEAPPAFEIQRLGLMTGEVFLPVPGFEFGFTGEMLIDGNGPYEFGVMLEMVGEFPNPRYLQLKIKELEMGLLVDLILRRTGIMQRIHQQLFLSAENIYLFWAESELALPDGRIISPGFGISAELKIFGHPLYGHVEINLPDTLAGEFMMKAVSIGILKLSGNGKGLFIRQQRNPVTHRLEDIPNIMPGPHASGQHHTERVVVPAGGPEISVGLHSPYVSGSFTAELLGMTSVNAELEMSDDGFTVHFDCDLPNIIGLDFEGKLLKEGTLFADGGFYVGGTLPLKGEFMGFSFDLSITLTMRASLTVDLDVNGNDTVSLSFYVNLFGWEITAAASQHIAFRHISDLPALMNTMLVTSVFDGLADIIRFIFQRDEWLSTHRLSAHRENTAGHHLTRQEYISQLQQRSNGERNGEAEPELAPYENWTQYRERIAAIEQSTMTRTASQAHEFDVSGQQFYSNQLQEAQRILEEWREKSEHLQPELRTSEKDHDIVRRQADIARWKSEINSYSRDSVSDRIQQLVHARISAIQNQAAQSVHNIKNR